MLEVFTSFIEILGSAGPHIITISVLLIFGYGFFTGWWVPGYIYKREIDRGDRAEDAVDASTRTTELATNATKAATDTALSVAKELLAIQNAINRAGK